MRRFDDDADLKGRPMKLPAIITIAVAAIVVAASAGPTTAEARGYRHHHSCGYTLYYDYSRGSVQSPETAIYPAANWGPFFACQRHIGPVVYAAPTGS
jgi:predicted lipoprotein with Yx(FWY)xxD motif